MHVCRPTNLTTIRHTIHTFNRFAVSSSIHFVSVSTVGVLSPYFVISVSLSTLNLGAFSPLVTTEPLNQASAKSDDTAAEKTITKT